MKLFVVSNMYPDQEHPYYGIFVKKMCGQLEKSGFDCDYSVMTKSDNKFQKIISYFSFYFLTIFKLLFAKYDAVYVHYASHSSIPVLAANLFKKKPIYTNLHGSDVVPENKQQAKMQKYTKKILLNSKKIIVPSEYFKKYVCDKYKIDKTKVFVFPSGGINNKIFHKLTKEQLSDVVDKYKLKINIPVFTMAGRISTDKGWDTFVKAIKILKDKGLKANYIIVGTGHEEKYLNSLINNYGLKNDIIRIPLLSQEQLAKIYAVSDYFVFPTRREGESLGLVAIESMACGTPVIASDFAAPGYYVKDGYNGFKFEVNNADALAELMIKCYDLKDSDEYSRLVNGSLSTAEEYFEERIIGKLIRVFD